MPDPQDDQDEDPQDQPEEHAYELVIPFVTVASKGGPHDDASYAAGWECGAIDARLQLCCAARATPEPMTVHAVNVPQIDLLAMRYGYAMTHEAAAEQDGHWAVASFRFPDVTPQT